MRNGWIDSLAFSRPALHTSAGCRVQRGKSKSSDLLKHCGSTGYVRHMDFPSFSIAANR
jgi:hypothetical protein